MDWLEALPPTPYERLFPIQRVQYDRAGLPGNLLHVMVFDLERMLLGNGVDSHLGVLELSKSHIDPHIFEYIRKLTEELKDPFQPVGEQLVHTVLYRIG